MGEERRAGAQKQACRGGGGRKGMGKAVRDSWRRRAGGGFQDEAGEVKEEQERIAEGGRFGRVGKAEPGGTFQVVAGLGGIAALGIGLSADAEFPGIGADGQVTGQADRAIREGQAGGDGSAKWMSRIGKGTGVVRGLLCGGNLNIGFRLVETFLSADPFGGLVLVVVAIAGQTVAEWAEGDAVVVIAALQAGQG